MRGVRRELCLLAVLVLVVADADTAAAQEAAAATAGGGLVPLAPCRLIDTRDASGPVGGPALLAGHVRVFQLASRCGIPAGARALSVNVTVTGATAGGELRFFPEGLPIPVASTISYSARQTRANNAIVGLGPLTDVSVYCAQPSGSAHVIVDVNGVLGQGSFSLSFPSSSTFLGQIGGIAPPVQSLRVRNTGTQSVCFALTHVRPWLAINSTGACMGPGLSVGPVLSVSLSGLTSGTYSDTVTLTAHDPTTRAPLDGVGGTIPVTLTVYPAGAPLMNVFPLSLSFTTQGGTLTPSAQVVNLTNGGATTLAWAVSSDAAWLPISPASGSATPGWNTPFLLYPAPAGLSAGTHTAHLTFTGNAIDTPQVVTVTLQVAAP